MAKIEIEIEPDLKDRESSTSNTSPYLPILFSAVAFPGTGQWMQGNRARAILFGGGALVCFGAWMVAVVLRTFEISQDITSIDEFAYHGDKYRLVFQTFRESAVFVYQAVRETVIFILPLVTIWAASVADAFHAARLTAKHSSNQSVGQPVNKSAANSGNTPHTDKNNKLN